MFKRNGRKLRQILKKALVVSTCLTLPVIAWAQWTTSSNDIYNSNSGNIGIGTSSPATKLDIVGGTLTIQDRGDGCCAAVRLVDAGLETHFYSYSSGDFQIHKYGSGSPGGAVFTILNNGNVGVGMTSPGRNLDVEGAIRTSYGAYGTPAIDIPSGGGYIQLGDRGAIQSWPSEGLAGTYLTHNAVHHGGYGWKNTVDASLSMIQAGTGTIDFFTNTSPGSAGTPFTPSERMRVDSNGNVGIGTTSPASKLDVNGDVTVSGNISAKYQDLAEWVPSSENISPGTVVIQDPNGVNSVMASTEAYDTRVAGVVSANPGIVLGEAGVGKVRVATTGRVKVHVDASLGPIRAGDLLVTSDKAGIAMRSEPVEVAGIKMHRPGTLIGKALEPLKEGDREILVLLSLQ